MGSDSFLPILTRWTDSLSARGIHGSKADPLDVPSDVQKEAQSSKVPEVRWVIKRLLSGEAMHRGAPHFPSTLLLKGPQYPFEPYELTYLRSRVGSIRLTEMAKKMELPEVKDAPLQQEAPPRDLWAEGCL